MFHISWFSEAGKKKRSERFVFLKPGDFVVVRLSMKFSDASTLQVQTEKERESPQPLGPLGSSAILRTEEASLEIDVVHCLNAKTFATPVEKRVRHWRLARRIKQKNFRKGRQEKQ